MLIISGIVVIIIGIIALFFSVYGRKSYLSKKKKCTSVIDGTLVRFAEKETTGRHVYNDIYYYPVYEYCIGDNKYEVQSSYGKNIVDYSQLGQKKKILYNPDNCEESFVSGENLKNAFNIVKFFGILFLVIGVIEIALYIILKVLM